MELLTIENLGVTYPDGDKERTILDGIDLKIHQGEWVSIIGPSGCGKTTLLHCIAGLRPYSGKISFSRHDTDLNQLGYVFQTPRLLNWLTLRDNILLPINASKVSTVETAPHVQKLMAVFKIDHLADKYPLSCSEGEKARAALARAFVVDSQLILMDEPFGSLDQITADSIRQNLRQLLEKTGQSFLFVTHNLAEAALLSDRVLVMSKKTARIMMDFPIDLPRLRDGSVRLKAAQMELELRRMLEQA